ncbi:hypothetical protein F441_15038 [Phytophthora nicotianae CJ01A1]|uniref:Uncharacterized protein n=4 Tax=Phytophthora nicotianae TaxID=4792 RepID=W2PU47_PHYN3|nr:hypothetical protein PPTG_15946 [Phytophthora nicotianae INRA-310]ETI39167.1 hypothetical protein F443_15228 [Phytophthora nicotianae P1569]ETK79381.1 hypothetical protein L915_14767 [Phytophthora nicotianae]ETP09092.1 hypothetical protein F441_15038 [Phytophthora nicotianae CJ01A1]ETL32794.1 hypothetical protein L916_14681 [Phytophthora nicotianae]ETL86061.1 hypothetical protein L917_14487 [Phytophthora nicotianae]
MFGAAQLAASTPALQPSLPKFSTREARFRKARDANTLIFSVPTRSSLLLPLLRPVCHTYEQQDARCLHLLQAAALVPSCKCNKLLATVTQALKMPLPAATRSQLETKLRPLITKLRDEDKESATRPLLALQLKEKVAECLRCWIAEPIDGFVLRKEHVVNGMRLDDLVATPAGAGYLRGYRREDGICTVVYPWGHGFVHVKDVEKVKQALEKHLKKRTYNEYVALEHQQLYEQIEGLVENLPPAPEESYAVKKEVEKEEEGDVEEYKELLKSLEEEHVDTTVLREDLGLLRRVQALTNKVKELRRAQSAKEPELKMLRTDEDEEMAGDAEQQEPDESMQNQDQTGEQKQEQESQLSDKEEAPSSEHKEEKEQHQ